VSKLLDAVGRRRAKRARARFKPKRLSGPDDARAYLAGLPGGKGGFDPTLTSGINEQLRAGNPTPQAKALSAAMKPLPDDLQLYRRVPKKKFGAVAPEQLVGMSVKDAGFFPTTVAPARGAPDDVQLHVAAPAGTRAAVAPDTHEVVLDAGTELAVERVETRPDGGTDMHLVAVDAAGDGSGRADDASSAPEPQDGDGPPAPADSGADTFEERAAAALNGPDALASVPVNAEDDDLDLPPEQAEAMFHYFNRGFIDINNQLRAGELDPETRIPGWVDNLDAIMAGSTLPQDVEVWRGHGSARAMFGDRLDGDMTGMEWREDAYLSTSTREDVSAGFAADSGDPEDAVLMRMVAPAGVGGMVVSGDDFEAEILLERGLRLRVVADHGGTPRRIDVEVVPADAEAT
jgi:hypothetical protein